MDWLVAAMASKVRPSLHLRLVVVAVLAGTVASFARAAAVPAFDDSYEAQYGADGHHLINRVTEVNLILDRSSGKFLPARRRRRRS